LGDVCGNARIAGEFRLLLDRGGLAVVRTTGIDAKPFGIRVRRPQVDRSVVHWKAARLEGLVDVVDPGEVTACADCLRPAIGVGKGVVGPLPEMIGLVDRELHEGLVDSGRLECVEHRRRPAVTPEIDHWPANQKIDLALRVRDVLLGQRGEPTLRLCVDAEALCDRHVAPRREELAARRTRVRQPVGCVCRVRVRAPPLGRSAQKGTPSDRALAHAKRHVVMRLQNADPAFVVRRIDATEEFHATLREPIEAAGRNGRVGWDREAAVEGKNGLAGPVGRKQRVGIDDSRGQVLIGISVQRHHELARRCVDFDVEFEVDAFVRRHVCNQSPLVELRRIRHDEPVASTAVGVTPDRSRLLDGDLDARVGIVEVHQNRAGRAVEGQDGAEAHAGCQKAEQRGPHPDDESGSKSGVGMYRGHSGFPELRDLEPVQASADPQLTKIAEDDRRKKLRSGCRASSRREIPCCRRAVFCQALSRRSVCSCSGSLPGDKDLAMRLLWFRGFTPLGGGFDSRRLHHLSDSVQKGVAEAQPQALWSDRFPRTFLDLTELAN